jgi:protein-S-isoprenylcysteine O-methyltransferase Ste14
MDTLGNIWGKILYGALFIALLPFCLYRWAVATKLIIHIPVPGIPLAGWLLLVNGSIFLVFGMAGLMRYGKGLPMNAYPPKYFVSKGIYAITGHPIYFGSGLISFGISLILFSSSGFWLVSPLFCIAMVAYVLGFENEHIKKTAGYFESIKFFSLPENTDTSPSLADRFNIFVLILLPWLIIYELFIFIGKPRDAVFTNMYFEQRLPVIEYSELFYILPYFLIVCLPFLLKTKSQVRNFMLDAGWAMFFAFFIYAAFPFVVQQRSFVPENFLGLLIYRERSYDGVSAALPAFHVIWAFLSSKYYSIRFGFKIYWQLLAIIISLSCIMNGSHSIADAIGGWLVFLMASKRIILWNAIRRFTERISNSWTEWHFGQVRLINHSFYAGAAAFVGVLIVDSCLGKSYSFAGFFITISGIAGAALWAQYIEGSPRLLRPYGYYGSVIGILVSTTFMSYVYHLNLMYILAAFALAGPWIQILGRLRCLVQGCCHGKPCSSELGIRFMHSQSRVLKIAGMKGIYIHPTQLYSIFSNFGIGLLLIRFYSLQMNVSFITGMYLILNGLARFVEEAFRGEPQTAYWKGLRLYQWIAILSIIMGAIVTTLPVYLTLNIKYNSGAGFFAGITAVIAVACYGVDFPNSKKRFARLTS